MRGEGHERLIIDMNFSNDLLPLRWYVFLPCFPGPLLTCSRAVLKQQHKGGQPTPNWV